MDVATSKSIDGITDLVVVAPIKRGVIDAFENLTYESRLTVVAEALHKIRANAREHEKVVPFADTVERILTLFNFRIGIIDETTLGLDLTQAQLRELPGGGGDKNADLVPKRFMFLAATFDGPLEPYLRLIWDPLGPFLDLLLCNCEGYKFATEVGFPEYLDWVRKHQVEPAIFYSTSGLTLRDQFYLSQLEKRQRDGDPATGKAAKDEHLAALTLTDPDQAARATWSPANPDIGDAIRLSLEALKVLYRLADYFPPEKREGRILLRAARDLLHGLEDRIDEMAKVEAIKKILVLFGLFPQERLGPLTEQWLWFKSGKTQPPKPSPTPKIPLGEVQKGLLSPYEDGDLVIRNSAVMMLSIRDPKRAALAIQLLFKPSYEDGPLASEGRFWPFLTAKTLAFTPEGLVKMGLAERDLYRFPREFVEGLFERAPMLGDIRDNHPRRWEFPLRRDLDRGDEDNDRPAIHAEEVDLIFQLRIASRATSDEESQFIDYEEQIRRLDAELREEGLLGEIDGAIALAMEIPPDAIVGDKVLSAGEWSDGENGEPSLDEMEAELTAVFDLADSLRRGDKGRVSTIFRSYDLIAVQVQLLTRIHKRIGLRILAVEPGYRDLDQTKTNTDHFGFVDGISQPDPEAQEAHPLHAKPGDLLLGLPNSLGDGEDDLSQYQSIDGIPLTYGSFMVFRKIAQFPERLEALKDMHEADVHEMIVGRRQDGTPLITSTSSDANDFTYDKDTEQEHCPFSAHIRLANPRNSFHNRPNPKILRRGMSYGKRFDASDPASKDAPRGLLFIAYNASLAEQYEVIQKWLNRGNPTGVSSAANDPLTGVQQSDDGYTFRYRNRSSGAVERVRIKQPLTQVKWGLYGFVPSRSGLDAICAKALRSGTHATRTVGRGGRQEEEDAFEKINMLLNQSHTVQREEWKRLIEDAAVKDPAKGNELPKIWRAIRNRLDGVLRLESGIAFGGNNLPQEERQAEQSQKAVLVAKWDHIRTVLSEPATFTVSEQGRRTRNSFGAIYVAMDPDPADSLDNRQSQYAKEAIDTNQIVMDFGKAHADDVFVEAYKLAADRLKRARNFATSIQTGSDKPPFYKIELRRDFLVPVLGGLCQWLFDIPDAKHDVPNVGYIEQGPWGVAEVDTSGGQSAANGMRKPRCPADFMAPSRRSFYPRPTSAIIEYGNKHGLALRRSSRNLVMNRVANGNGFVGQISSLMAEELLSKPVPSLPEQDLLARNIIGLMEGMLPPTDGLMRGIMFDWIDKNVIWQHQSKYFDAVKLEARNLSVVTEALEEAVESAIRKRPAPDLIYRTAKTDTKIGQVEVKAGDLIVLALGSAMQEEPAAGYDGGIWPVFGGHRQDAFQKPGTPTHACPAHPIVMAMIYGMISALFDAGRIVIQPASLILRISDWNNTDGGGSKSTTQASTGAFSPFV